MTTSTRCWRNCTMPASRWTSASSKASSAASAGSRTPRTRASSRGNRPDNHSFSVAAEPCHERYSGAHVLDVLEHRIPDPAEHDWITRDFHGRELGTDTCLLTCTLEQGERVSRRSTIWRRRADDWVILFHQGTLVAVS
ncbi:hypothetical protein [Rhodanobacter thiooxydans]|uniref:hypothetical protein n=1 Tax=Rhodanobacter thiooxydans TaxID=416169 RepID=UPI001900FDCC|nr:hypothetical protein [Rhodanobacter thiooxydans]